MAQVLKLLISNHHTDTVQDHSPAKNHVEAHADGLYHVYAYKAVVPAQEKPAVVRLCEGGGGHQPGAVVPTLAAGSLTILVNLSFSSTKICHTTTACK